MATTKAKESSGLGKERKLTAPSSVTIPNTPTKRTPKSSPRSTSTDHHKLSSSSSFSSSSSPSLSTLSEKHVPNYLKSTASSRHDHGFKPVKKPAGPTPIPEGRPSLNRRRSFDKPPPTAPRLEKPFRSPGPRNRATHVPARSSSFGAKPTSSSTTFVSSAKPPGFLERSASKISKVGVGGKLQQPVQNLRSSSNAKKSLKRESSNAASGMAEIVPKTKNAVEHVDQCPFVLGVNEEELKKIECELDPYLPDPMPEFYKQLRTDQVDKKADVLDKEEADRKYEADKKLIQHHHPIQHAEIFNVETETPPIQADPKSLIQQEENREPNQGVGEEEAKDDEEKPQRIAEAKEVVVAVVALEESGNDKNEEKILTEEKTETETDPDPDPGREGVVVLDQKKEAQDGQRCKEDNNNTTTKAETAEKEAEATEKAEKEAEVVAEKVATAAGKQRQGGPGRKESPAMYNDVIEETASKLLEKRKNKVRALAGAFQTVIDYESSSK